MKPLREDLHGKEAWIFHVSFFHGENVKEGPETIC